MKKEYDFSRAKRGPIVRETSAKTRVTIRLDTAVLDWFRNQAHQAGGASYQALINQALVRHMAATREPLENTLRRVIREELRKTG
jgi:uncharacterized protein (DUF4415 family)